MPYCYSLDLASNTWSSMRSMTKGRKFPALVYNSNLNRFYAISKEHSLNGTTVIEIDKYSFSESKGWIEITSIMSNCKTIKAVSHGWHIFLYEVPMNNSLKGIIRIMDVRTESWHEIITPFAGMN